MIHHADPLKYYDPLPPPAPVELGVVNFVGTCMVTATKYTQQGTSLLRYIYNICVSTEVR